MAEPDDPDLKPTQSWDSRGEAPTIPKTPTPRRDSKPSSGAGRGIWEPPTPEELQPSFPQYEIRAMLGRGGMGAVYKGWQKRLDRFVAIKILPPQLEEVHANFAERFQREAKAMARFAHPGIVSVYDAGETADGLLYFIMEYIEGTDVQRMLAAERHLSPQQALSITQQVCEALEYAHRRGVIHRDIKPSNIMVDAEGRVKVTDFGLAKVANDDSAALLTATHAYLGTPDFMAPEAWQGASQVDQRADLFAVGVMLYRMLTGHLPRGRFEPPSQRVPGLDVRFDSIIDHALQTDPDKRYSSASEIRTDLEKITSESLASMQTMALETPLPPPLPASSPPSAPSAAPSARPASAAPSATPASAVPAASAAPARPSGASAAPSVAPSGAGTPPVIHTPAPQYSVKATVLLFVGILGLFLVVSVTFLVLHFRNESTVVAENITPAPTPAVTSPKPETPPPPQATPKATPNVVAVTTPTPKPAAPTPFVNTLGMTFVPVPIKGGPTGGQQVLFSIWETRVQDYRVFATETKRSWMKVTFPQESTHPAVNVTWDDAQAFCQWLTQREIAAGKLAPNQYYRLPTDHEWSCAVGIGDREDATKAPADNDKLLPNIYPWGAGWPPPSGTGNYSGEEVTGHKNWPDQKILSNYRDPFPATAPVGSFAPNALGLFDLGGNAWEWCEDRWKPGDPQRTLRGASYTIATQTVLLSSERYHLSPSLPDDSTGFRCVLATKGPTTQGNVVATAPPSIAAMLTSPDYEWSKPENLGPGVNGPKDEYAMGISDDGLVLVLSSTRNGSEHLFECRRSGVDQPFGPAKQIDELKAGVQSCPFLSGDGLTLLYSLRSDSGSTGDIYQSHRASRSDRWDKPRRVFAPGSYNSGPYLSPDGLALWFHSNRPGGRGGFDLWRSLRTSPTVPFGEPANPGAEVNTDADELSPRASADGFVLLFYRERKGTGQRLFATVWSTNGAFTTQPLALPINGRTQSPTLSADGHILYFASDMPGGQGGWDLWQIRRVPKR